MHLFQLPILKWGFYAHFPSSTWVSPRMTTATRQDVLRLYRRIFRLARRWQAASGQGEDTAREKQYILQEARTLFQKNKNVSSLSRRSEIARRRAASCVYFLS